MIYASLPTIMRMIIICVDGVSSMSSAGRYNSMLDYIRLGLAVRYALAQDEISMIIRFLCHDGGRDLNDPVASIGHFDHQLELLIEAACDHSIPPHWRHACMDNLYRPLFALRQFSEDPCVRQQIAVRLQQIRTIALH